MSIKQSPKILFVTPVFPDDTGYGLAMRAGALLEGLAAIGDVYLLVVPVFDPGRNDLSEAARQHCTEYRIVKITPADRLAGNVTTFLSSYRQQSSPLPVLNSQRLQHAAEAGFKEIPFDYVYVFRLYMAQLMTSRLSGNTVQGRFLDIDDIESVTRNRLAALYRKNGLIKKARQEEKAAKQFEVFERQQLPMFDSVAVCSHGDRARIRDKLPENTIHVLPNVIRCRENAQLAGSSDIFNMLFVGNLNYYPNQDALAFFIDEILPLLREQTTRRLNFTIVGSGKWPGIAARQHVKECDFVGYVADVAPYYQQADAVVVPLRAGGGTRIKILEAFSFRKPVVTTSSGIEGISAEDEAQVLIADQPARFAAQICRIMEDLPLAERLTTRAHKMLIENYTIDVLKHRLANMIKSTLERSDISSTDSKH